jgi:hypothetical protein
MLLSVRFMSVQSHVRKLKETLTDAVQTHMRPPSGEPGGDWANGGVRSCLLLTARRRCEASGAFSETSTASPARYGSKHAGPDLQRRRAAKEGLVICYMSAGASIRFPGLVPVKRGDSWTAGGGPDYAGKPRPMTIVQREAFETLDSGAADHAGSSRRLDHECLYGSN